tara:strand:+ start:309 stop:566 length:258 start_codon:yes stop_codon:yes gene_type:complete
MTGDELKNFRKSKNWTQAELAKELNSSLMYITLLEAGDAIIQGRIELEIQHASGIQLLDEKQLIKIYGDSRRKAMKAGECLDTLG